jgi:hypothetical protein
MNGLLHDEEDEDVVGGQGQEGVKRERGTKRKNEDRGAMGRDVGLGLGLGLGMSMDERNVMREKERTGEQRNRRDTRLLSILINAAFQVSDKLRFELVAGREMGIKLSECHFVACHPHQPTSWAGMYPQGSDFYLLSGCAMSQCSKRTTRWHLSNMTIGGNSCHTSIFISMT